MEYFDLIGDNGGIDLYRPEMAFDNYIPIGGVDGELRVEEKKYLSLLIEESQKSKLIPALCATRSLARSRAIKKAFGGTHLLLTRNIHEQWCSFSEQAASGNRYFLDSLVRQVEASRHDPFLGQLSHLAEKGRIHTDSAESYALFLLFQLYSNAVAFDACHIHIDSTDVATSEAKRHAAETNLSRLLHSEIDLGDARAHISYSTIESKHRTQAEMLARQFLPELVVPNASIECQSYVRKAFDEAFSCWDSSIYHTEATRTFFGKILEAKEREAKELEAKVLEATGLEAKELQARILEAKDLKAKFLYFSQRSLWEALIFRPSGKPKKAFRVLLFHESGRPRRMFKSLVLDRDGKPKKPFIMWMTSIEYQRLTCRESLT
jgi:hypothetical protein